LHTQFGDVPGHKHTRRCLVPHNSISIDDRGHGGICEVRKYNKIRWQWFRGGEGEGSVHMVCFQVGTY
jgi:hypothetical protein